MSGVRFVRLDDQGDARGALYRIPAELLRELGHVGDIHFGEIRPGALRGNHAHSGNTELVLLSWKDQCEIAYDEGEGQESKVVHLEGRGSAALLIPPNCAHAFRNTGAEVMEFTSMPSAPYEITDWVRRTLLS